MYASDDDHFTTGSEQVTLNLPDGRLAWISTHHRDIEMYCASLVKLARHLLTHGPDDWTRTTAETIVRFFEGDYSRICSEMDQEIYPLLKRLASPIDTQTLVSGAIDNLANTRADIEWIWADLRRKLYRIKNGEKEWLRKTQVHRFAKLNTERVNLEKSALLSFTSKI